MYFRERAIPRMLHSAPSVLFCILGAFGLIDVNWRMSAVFDALLVKTDHWAACHGPGGLFPSPYTSARLVPISANRCCRACRKSGTRACMLLPCSLRNLLENQNAQNQKNQNKKRVFFFLVPKKSWRILKMSTD